VLHADHELNASTFAARVAAATLTDIHSAVVAFAAAGSTTTDESSGARAVALELAKAEPGLVVHLAGG